MRTKHTRIDKQTYNCLIYRELWLRHGQRMGAVAEKFGLSLNYTVDCVKQARRGLLNGTYSQKHLQRARQLSWLYI